METEKIIINLQKEKAQLEKFIFDLICENRELDKKIADNNRKIEITNDELKKYSRYEMDNFSHRICRRILYSGLRKL